MEEFFNKPILDQLYDSIQEDFEQSVYENDEQVKEIEGSVQEKGEKLTAFLEKMISNPDDLEKAFHLFREYELEYSKEISFWSNAYFKLGICDRERLRNEFFKNRMKNDVNETYFRNEWNDISEWLEEQKRKYTFGTEEYKKLQKEYNKIGEKYPNVLEVFENLEPIVLNKEEINALIELRKIDIGIGNMEKKLCFELGMKEVINF